MNEAAPLPPLIADYVLYMHYAAVVLALCFPLVRWAVAGWRGRASYSVMTATHDGVAAGALPSLLAMVLSAITPDILQHIARAEYFGAGLLGLFSSVAHLFTFKEGRDYGSNWD